MRELNQPRLGRVMRGMVCCFVFLSTIQAIYWPILKSGKQLDWWQIHWMAQVGFYVGSIPLALCICVVLLGPASSRNSVIAVVGFGDLGHISVLGLGNDTEVDLTEKSQEDYEEIKFCFAASGGIAVSL